VPERKFVILRRLRSERWMLRRPSIHTGSQRLEFTTIAGVAGGERWFVGSSTLTGQSA